MLRKERGLRARWESINIRGMSHAVGCGEKFDEDLRGFEKSIFFGWLKPQIPSYALVFWLS